MARSLFGNAGFSGLVTDSSLGTSLFRPSSEQFSLGAQAVPDKDSGVLWAQATGENVALFRIEGALFPETKMELNVFEHRYRVMVKEALVNPATECFGVIAPGSTVGTAAFVSHVNTMRDDGKSNVIVSGMRRFRIVQGRNDGISFAKDSFGLWRANAVEFFEDDTPADASEVSALYDLTVKTVNVLLDVIGPSVVGANDDSPSSELSLVPVEEEDEDEEETESTSSTSRNENEEEETQRRCREKTLHLLEEKYSFGAMPPVNESELVSFWIASILRHSASDAMSEKWLQEVTTLARLQDQHDFLQSSL
jgi:hypothetical protein